MRAIQNVAARMGIESNNLYFVRFVSPRFQQWVRTHNPDWVWSDVLLRKGVDNQEVTRIQNLEDRLVEEWVTTVHSRTT